MTRKDYEAIAKVLKRHASLIPTQQYIVFIADLMDVFETDNPNFDKARFWKAVA